MLVLSLNIIWLLKNVMLTGISETLVKDTNKRKLLLTNETFFTFYELLYNFHCNN